MNESCLLLLLHHLFEEESVRDSFLCVCLFVSVCLSTSRACTIVLVGIPD